jgi:hypothetical protein
MRKKIWIISGITMVILATGLFAVLNSASGKSKIERSTCCKKSKPCKTEKTGRPGELIMDNLSRQFISLLPASY